MSTSSMPPPDAAVPSLLRPQQRAELENEIEVASQALKSGVAKDPQALRRVIHDTQKQLDEQGPKPFEAHEVDDRRKEADALRETITTGMLSQEEMRRNFAGSVGAHQRWETANKSNILRWKYLQLRLNHDSQDPDVANLERFRPTKALPLGYRDGQITGHMAYTAVPEANWHTALGDPKVETALAGAVKSQGTHVTVPPEPTATPTTAKAPHKKG